MFREFSRDRCGAEGIPESYKISFPTARVMWWWHDIVDPDLQTFLEQADDFLESLEQARQDEEDVEKRPIIFIGHGLGGILLKRVYVFHDRYDHLADYDTPDAASHEV